MHESRRDGGDRARSWRWSRLHLLLTGMLALVLLAACGGGGDDGPPDDRRFATDPREPEPTVTLAPPTPTAGAITATIPPDVTVSASPSPVIVSTVSTVYAIAGGAVIALDTTTNATRVLVRGSEGRTISRISPSADGEQVAILYSVPGDSKTRYDLEILTKAGEPVGSWSDIEAPLDPMSEPGKGRLVLDWENSAGKIGVAFPDGGAVMIAVSDQPRVLLKRSQAPGPLALQWTAKGDAVAFATKNANGDSPTLSIASVQALPIDPVRIPGVGGERPIETLTWLQDGSAVLVIQGSPSRDNQVGGDLIRVDRRTLKPMLLTGSNLFGPVAQIVAVSPSPDGGTIGYVTVDPRGGGGWIASVWVVDEGDQAPHRVPLQENPPVADINWTVAGFSVTLLEPDRVSVITVDDGGAIVGQAEATPVASPVAGVSPISATPGAAPTSVPIVASPQS